MSALSFIHQVRTALQHLNPAGVREEADRPVHIGLVAETPETLWEMESYFCPFQLSDAKRVQVLRMLHRVSLESRTRDFDIEIWDESMAMPDHAFSFHPSRPQNTVRAILRKHPELSLALARQFLPFRKPVIDRIISDVATENALFSIATAIPDIVPIISLPLALGEFASDTAFLTMNQIRMTFLIAAASDSLVGYGDQKAQIGSIVAGAFGFRAIARELVSKIPLGGGIIPKAAIAWTGTYVVGKSMERLYGVGAGFTRDEREQAYHAAIGRGREIAAGLIESFRRPQTN